MSTDRSLWVEDRYALRCRSCGERFTIFLRRHHCRRCGQVFCHECLYTPPNPSTRHALIDSVYQLLLPTRPAILDHPNVPLRGVELPKRICQRCVEVVTQQLWQHADHSTASPVERPPGSEPPDVRSSSVTRQLSYADATPDASKLTSLHGASFSTNASAAPQIPGETSLSHGVANEEPQSDVSWRLQRHKENEAEREITYSVESIYPLLPSRLERWVAHQLMVGKISRPPSEIYSLRSLEDTEATIRSLTDEQHFSASLTPLTKGLVKMGSAAFFVAADEVGKRERDVAPPFSSEASHRDTALSHFGRLYTTHLLQRALHSLQRAALDLDGVESASCLASHLCRNAWDTISQLSIPQGGSVLEHVGFLSVAVPRSSLASALYPGVVIPHNIASIRMAAYLSQPRVLLLAGDVSYAPQPSEELVDYVRSYKGYLDKLFERLLIWNPDIVVVEGGMHHYLQHRILQYGKMTVLLQVGREVLHRLCCCLHATIIADLQYVGVGELTGVSPLGTCSYFEVLRFAADVEYAAFSSSGEGSLSTLMWYGNQSSANLEALLKIQRECVVAAYHAAVHTRWLLLAQSFPFREPNISLWENVEATAAITLNPCCHFPPAVQEVTTQTASDAIRDTLLWNTIYMDRLFGDAAESVGAGSNPSLLTSSVPSTCRVEQRRLQMKFYGDGDECLLLFLNRHMTSKEMQIVFLHGNCRLRITTATLSTNHIAEDHPEYRVCPYPSYTMERQVDCSGAAETQQCSFPPQCNSKTLSGMRAFLRLAFRATVPDETNTMMTEVVPCPPHLLNCSAAAFMEFLIYAWLPRCGNHSAESHQSPFHAHPERLLLQFQFPDGVSGGSPPSPVGKMVSIEVGYISIFSIEYPPSQLQPLLDKDTVIAADGNSTAATVALYNKAELQSLQEELLALMVSTTSALEMVGKVQYQHYSPPTSSANALPVTSSANTTSNTTVATPTTTTGSLPSHDDWDATIAKNVEEVKSLYASVASAVEFVKGLVAENQLLSDAVQLRQQHLLPLLARLEEWHARWKCHTQLLPCPQETDITDVTETEDQDEVYCCLESGTVVRPSEPSSVLAAAIIVDCTVVQNTGHSAMGIGNTENRLPNLKETSPPAIPPEAAEMPPSVELEPAESRAHFQNENITTELLKRTATLHSENDVCTVGRAESTGITNCSVALAALRDAGGAQCTSAGGNDGVACTQRRCSLTLTGISKSSVAAVVPTVTVETLYPVAFAALRYLYTSGRPATMMSSLLRCRPLRTEGGKSNSRFYVTEDGRLLLKRIKLAELRHFKEFAPLYFDALHHYYSKDSTGTERPSKPSNASGKEETSFGALAKIMGLYTIHIHGARRKAFVLPQGGLQSRMDLEDGTHYFMLSENLLHRCRAQLTFDLKGSQRNRATGPSARVRLDVDLVCEHLRNSNFFFCSPASKSRLMDQLSSCTQLFVNGVVMDYSLIVAVGDGDQLHIGIIDYLHPYSNVKVLESKMKSGLDSVFGYGKSTPTIIDPISYSTRFLKWMDGYFCEVPDRVSVLHCT